METVKPKCWPVRNHGPLHAKMGVLARTTAREAQVTRRTERALGNTGEVAEWSNAAVLKTVDRQRSGGSNPSLSASHEKGPASGAFLMAC